MNHKWKFVRRIRSCSRLPNRNPETLIGMKFGRLVLHSIIKSADRGPVRFGCLCECGKRTTVNFQRLRPRTNVSCGCAMGGCNRLPPTVSAFNSLIYRYKYGSRLKKRAFRISRRQCVFLFQSNCHWCGSNPSGILLNPRANGAYIYNGIDRIDNSRGYIIGNVVSCCAICNRLKGSLTVADWNRIQDHMANIVTHRAKKRLTA